MSCHSDGSSWDQDCPVQNTDLKEKAGGGPGNEDKGKDFLDLFVLWLLIINMKSFELEKWNHYSMIMAQWASNRTRFESKNCCYELRLLGEVW